MSTLPAALRADCSRCAGLCCVVPAFYAVQGFGFDKPAHEPCAHLTVADRCAIHAERAALGFPSCVGFECYGAGQRVTQEIFPGTSWRSSAETAARVFAAYSTCVALHRFMAALALAERNASAPLAARLRAKRDELDELCRSEDAKHGRVDIRRVSAEAADLVREALGEPSRARRTATAAPRCATGATPSRGPRG